MEEFCARPEKALLDFLIERDVGTPEPIDRLLRIADQEQAPYETVLGQMVTVRESGTERPTAAAEAFLLQLAKRGLEGDGAAARAAMHAIEEVRNKRIVGEPHTLILSWRRTQGSVNTALEILRMAKLLDPYRDSARTMLEPWIVEAALARFGDRCLTAHEQRIVVKATRTPHKVRWPEWWTERE